jgi:GAF domain-containing protein
VAPGLGRHTGHAPLFQENAPMKPSSHILKLYLGMSPGANEEMILRLLIDLGRQYARADEGSLLILDPKKNCLVFAMTSGSRATEKVLLGQRVPLGQGLTGLAAATGEVQIGSPTFKGVRQRKRRGQSTDHPTAVIAAPMLVRDEVIGVLTAASFGPDRRFTQEDGEFYGKIAAVAGVVVDQQQRLETLQRIATGRQPQRALTSQQRTEARIIDSVTCLAAGDSKRLQQVAAVLTAFEPLCHGSRP